MQRAEGRPVRLGAEVAGTQDAPPWHGHRVGRLVPHCPGDTQPVVEGAARRADPRGGGRPRRRLARNGQPGPARGENVSDRAQVVLAPRASSPTPPTMLRAHS